MLIPGITFLSTRAVDKMGMLADPVPGNLENRINFSANCPLLVYADVCDFDE